MSKLAALRAIVYLIAVLVLPYAVARDWTDHDTAERVIAMLAAGAVPALAVANLPTPPSKTGTDHLEGGDGYVGRHRHG